MFHPWWPVCKDEQNLKEILRYQNLKAAPEALQERGIAMVEDMKITFCAPNKTLWLETYIVWRCSIAKERVVVKWLHMAPKSMWHDFIFCPVKVKEPEYEHGFLEQQKTT